MKKILRAIFSPLSNRNSKNQRPNEEVDSLEQKRQQYSEIIPSSRHLEIISNSMSMQKQFLTQMWGNGAALILLS